MNPTFERTTDHYIDVMVDGVCVQQVPWRPSWPDPVFEVEGNCVRTWHPDRSIGLVAQWRRYSE